MFMTSSLLSGVDARTRDTKYATTVARLLTTYADTRQRPDGLFIHALDGPHAWGRGNGFAALGFADALHYLPAEWTDRARVLDIHRRHMRALVPHQTEDGLRRRVVDDPMSYREFTGTAMTVAAMARGVRARWLDATFVPAINRAWAARWRSWPRWPWPSSHHRPTSTARFRAPALPDSPHNPAEREACHG